MKVEEFVFIKKSNGKVRNIIGTTDFESLQDKDFFKKPTNIRESNPNVVPFWDLEENHWKCYVKENLISRRPVKNKPIKKRITDNDFYNKNSFKETIIKRNKTPFFILSVLFTWKELNQNEIKAIILNVINKVKISKNIDRNVKRILKSFEINKLVTKKDNKYKLTDEGITFLSKNVKSKYPKEKILCQYLL